MFKFATSQKLVHLGGVAFGGEIGEYPTVLMGSIFFRGHRIVTDPSKGLFDRAKAKDLLEQEGELSELTGNPRVIDVVGETSHALITYIEFVATHTQAPILVDSPSPSVRIETVRHFEGSELLDRLVYNSIAEDCTAEDLANIKECGIRSAIVLAFSTRALRPVDKLKLLQEKLLPASQAAGIENLLIDVGVLDLPSVGWACRSIWEVRNTLGLPAGCAPSNALYQWKMKNRGPTAFAAASGAVLSLPQCHGANFLLYGSIGHAPWVYPACAAADSLLAYRARLDGIQVKADAHPLFRIL